MSTTPPPAEPPSAESAPPQLVLGPVRRPQEPAADAPPTADAPPVADAPEAAEVSPSAEGGDGSLEAGATVRLVAKRVRGDETVQLVTAPADDPEGTVRLGTAAPAAAAGPAEPVAVDGTVRLGTARPPADRGPDGDGTVRFGTKPAVPVRGEDGDGTVRLGAKPVGTGDPESTVRLGGTAPVEMAETVRLPGPGAEAATVRLEAGAPGHGRAASAGAAVAAGGAAALEGFESATHLDPEVWAKPQEAAPAAPASPAASAGEAAPAPAGQGEELRRFGPGVPPQAAAVWHGATAPVAEPERRKRRGWLVLPVVLALAVAGWVGWERWGRPVAVVGAEARTEAAGPGCDGTAVVTGIVETDGGAGTVTYRWLRSDGTDSGVISQHVESGRQRTEVTLRWTFQGHGRMDATATLEVLTPGTATSKASFVYDCS